MLHNKKKYKINKLLVKYGIWCVRKPIMGTNISYEFEILDGTRGLKKIKKKTCSNKFSYLFRNLILIMRKKHFHRLALSFYISKNS